MSAELFGDGADNRLRETLDAGFERLPPDWRAVTEAFRRSAAGRALIGFVDARVAAGATVYPATPFRALELTPLHAVRVVILGQDPYHGAGQAQGLAFSVPDGMRLPPSLRNIRAEITAETGRPPRGEGSLEDWARQGVLLLNSVLTVERGKAASHQNRGWEGFTDAAIAALNEERSSLVFMLWGSYA
ncbi:MAG: hypothetical protein RLZZ598_1193, partial [Pseudomonadota bacterium]